jgi:hypothetical protein
MVRIVNATRPILLRTSLALALVSLAFGYSGSIHASDWPALDAATAGARWPTQKLSSENYRKHIEFVRPTEKELAWQKVRWHTELEDAAREAKKLQRPILLWTMNGHPCGET